MGNNISQPDWVLSEEEIIDFIRRNPETFLEFSGELEDVPQRKRLRNLSRADWWASPWGKMIQDPNIRDINTREGREFRRRFRLPGPFFLDWLVPKCIEMDVFKTSGDFIVCKKVLLDLV